MATLMLTPAVRLACLALCAAPAAMAHAAAAPAHDRQPSAGAAAAHAHHHQQADAAPPSTATADAAARPVDGARCDTAPGTLCADAADAVSRPTPRASSGDVAITVLRPWLAATGNAARLNPSAPPTRVAPPGPPPAPTPLRV
jgi:hypothetical protein